MSPASAIRPNYHFGDQLAFNAGLR